MSVTTKLKLVTSGKGKYPRHIIAELERGTKPVGSADHRKRMVRRYSTPQRALIGACRWMVQSGYVKDTITIYREESSRVYGTVKVTLKGRIKVEWDDE